MQLSLLKFLSESVLSIMNEFEQYAVRYPTRFLTEIVTNDFDETFYKVTNNFTDEVNYFILKGSKKIDYTNYSKYNPFDTRTVSKMLVESIKGDNLKGTKWNARFLNLAKTISSYSKDPSTKVGAVIVDDDDNVRTIGYNGFPRGVKDTEERLNDRSIKYPLTVHAELNAICTCARVGVPTKGATMVCTHFPCADCAGAIVQAGFKEVVVLSPTEDFDSRWKETNALALTIFIEGKVDVVVFTEDELKEDENVT